MPDDAFDFSEDSNVVPLPTKEVPRPEKPYDDPSARYRLDEFLDAHLEVPPTLIEGITPGGTVMVLAGQHKVGKTLMMTQLAMSVASGKPFLGFETEQTKVLYLNFEVAGWSFRNRLKQQLWGFGKSHGTKAVEDIKENLYVRSLPKLRLNNPSQLTQLGEWVKDEDIGLVIIDPIRGSFIGNRNSDEEVDRVMQDIIEKVVGVSGATVLLGHHMRKPPPGERVSGSSWEVKGSSSWADAADAIVTLRWDKTQKLYRYVGFTLRHYDSPDDMTLELASSTLLFEVSEGPVSDRELLRRAFQVEEHGKPELELTMNELCDKLDRPKSTVHRWLSEGDHPVEQVGSGRGTRYRWVHES